MKIPVLRPLLIAGIAATMAGCGSSAPRIVSTPIENIDQTPLRVTDLTETELQGWGGADLVADTVPGMSVQKAYEEIIKNHKGKAVIVGVIDSGVDIEHEDLEDVIWRNNDEKLNGKDDDNNGYVDDIHGWNFLGEAVEENLEYVRIYKRLRPKYEGIPASSVSSENRQEFVLYKEAQSEYQKEYNETLGMKNQYEGILQQLRIAHEAVSQQLGKEDYTRSELRAMEATSEEMQQYKGFLSQVMANVGENIPAAMDQLEEAIDYFSHRLNTHFNLELDGRAVVGDDPYDITDTDYGNNNVMGPTPDKEDIKHGTHVAGIIAAERNNGVGINGVANNAQIMAIRAVPDGDEYDKDVALAIRYAVDNGARVINTSFGKYFSTHPQWVNDAIRYAAENDVLIVNAAGNEGINLDEEAVYPNDQNPEDHSEITDNFLTVGALSYTYGPNLVASFSNYGKRSVDVFAPGTQIWSTTPNDEYEFLQGTSMAAPAVAGVAAMIRSFFPDLTAPQVKQIIMDSGLSSDATVILGGNPSNTREFSELSTSGKMVNLYNALIEADRISKQ